jgi:hypothetical protein
MSIDGTKVNVDSVARDDDTLDSNQTKPPTPTPTDEKSFVIMTLHILSRTILTFNESQQTLFLKAVAETLNRPQQLVAMLSVQQQHTNVTATVLVVEYAEAAARGTVQSMGAAFTDSLSRLLGPSFPTGFVLELGPTSVAHFSLVRAALYAANSSTHQQGSSLVDISCLEYTLTSFNTQVAMKTLPFWQTPNSTACQKQCDAHSGCSGWTFVEKKTSPLSVVCFLQRNTRSIGLAYPGARSGRTNGNCCSECNEGSSGEKECARLKLYSASVYVSCVRMHKSGGGSGTINIPASRPPSGPAVRGSMNPFTRINVIMFGIMVSMLCAALAYIQRKHHGLCKLRKQETQLQIEVSGGAASWGARPAARLRGGQSARWEEPSGGASSAWITSPRHTAAADGARWSLSLSPQCQARSLSQCQAHCTSRHDVREGDGIPEGGSVPSEAGFREFELQAAHSAELAAERYRKAELEAGVRGGGAANRVGPEQYNNGDTGAVDALVTRMVI